jgi:hypothetical protein
MEKGFSGFFKKIVYQKGGKLFRKGGEELILV